MCGWRTFFYAEVAASQDYGPINFVSDNNLQMKEWGGGIIEDQRKDKVFKLFYDLNECLAQIRFVINAPKQVTKPKGYVAALVTLILLIRS